MPSVEYYFDYASPFSYLASELLDRKLPGATIEHRPIYLRGFESFAKGLPFVPAKLAFLMADLRRCSEDEGVAFQIPPSFPINGLYALRGALAAQRAGCFDAYHPTMFRAAWRDRRDISSKAAVAEIANELGLAEVAGALDDAAIKDQLRTDTETAAKRGVFGVPTFFVGGELFWGHDRLYQVAVALGLPRPPTGRAPA